MFSHEPFWPPVPGRNAIAFLVSDDARAITGVGLPVDGGQLQRG